MNTPPPVLGASALGATRSHPAPRVLPSVAPPLPAPTPGSFLRLAPR
jgi:hypothetical protein